MRSLIVLAILLLASFADANEAPAVPEMNEKTTKTGEGDGETAIATPENLSRYRCENNWFSFGSRCFTFVRFGMDWFRAQATCKRMGGFLAIATNRREATFLRLLSQTAGQPYVWLGGFNLEGRWMWINGDSMSYFNWEYEAPSTLAPCVSLHRGYGWRNTACTRAFPFICAKSALMRTLSM